jgi:hypothetical protein
VGLQIQKPPEISKPKFKKAKLMWTRQCQKFYMIYPSREISHTPLLLTGTLEL